MFASMYSDFVYTGLFAMFILYLKDMIQTEAALIDETCLTTKDFAIQVDNLPPDTKANDLVVHF